jgi:undecaprenyl-diphosphatase
MILRHYKKFRELFPFLEPLALIGFVLLGFLIHSFWEVSEEVLEGDTHVIDTKLLMLLRDGNNAQNPLGPPWVAEAVRDVSGLGGIYILVFVVLSAAIYLTIIKRGGQALYLLATIGVGTAIANALKFGFDRPRPDLVPHGSHTFTASFPSGHTMMSAMVYLSVGMMLAKAQKTMPPRIFFMAISVFLTVVIGISRVYLGVHWPSDVLAGWLGGGSCAIAFWLFEWLWQNKILGQIKTAISNRG